MMGGVAVASAEEMPISTDLIVPDSEQEGIVMHLGDLEVPFPSPVYEFGRRVGGVLDRRGEKVLPSEDFSRMAITILRNAEPQLVINGEKLDLSTQSGLDKSCPACHEKVRYNDVIKLRKASIMIGRAVKKNFLEFVEQLRRRVSQPPYVNR